jgi:hypothetical protein
VQPPRAHTLVGAGAAEGAIDAASILKPMLARGELQTIGAGSSLPGRGAGARYVFPPCAPPLGLAAVSARREEITTHRTPPDL